MWVYLTDAFVSIVAHRDDADLLLVRVRFAGDLERLFPGAAVQETPDADYRFRAAVPRAKVGAVLAARAAEVDYPNFKATLPHRTAADRARARAYTQAHAALEAAQQAALAGTRPRGD